MPWRNAEHSVTLTVDEEWQWLSSVITCFVTTCSCGGLEFTIYNYSRFFGGVKNSQQVVDINYTGFNDLTS